MRYSFWSSVLLFHMRCRHVFCRSYWVRRPFCPGLPRRRTYMSCLLFPFCGVVLLQTKTLIRGLYASSYSNLETDLYLSCYCLSWLQNFFAIKVSNKKWSQNLKTLITMQINTYYTVLCDGPNSLIKKIKFNFFPAMFGRDDQRVWPGLGRHPNFHPQLLGTFWHLQTKDGKNGGDREISG